MTNTQIKQLLLELQGDRDQQDFAAELGISASAYSMLIRYGHLPEASRVRLKIEKYLANHKEELKP